MDKKIVDDVKRVAYSVLKDENILKQDNCDLSQVENMDSVRRVSILVAIEEEYDFIFKLKEISAWNTVYELADIIEHKLQ